MQLTVSQKVNLAGLISALTVLVIVAGALVSRTTLVGTLQRTKTHSAMADALNRLQLITQELINHETDYVLTQDVAHHARWEESLQRLLGVVGVFDGLLSASQPDFPRMRVILDDFVRAQLEYKKSFLEIHESISRAKREGRALDVDRIRSLHGDSLRRTRVAAGTMIEAAGDMVALNSQMAAQNTRDAMGAVGKIDVMVILLATFGLLTTVGLRLFAMRTVSRPLAILTAGAQKMARGAFELELNIRSNDEIGRLAKTLQEMAGDLRSLYASLEQKVNDRTAELARSNAELARSNAELERFAYVASHDLQEPLRTITSFAELLTRRHQGQLDAKADSYIRTMAEAASRMRDLIHGLLAYSRIGANEIPFGEVDCGALVAEVLASLEVAIRQAGADVIVDPLPTIRGEKIQLFQLFQNLIGNALKFQGDQPARIRVHASQKDGVWQFSVEDNGIGMEPQETHGLFMIFKRLHPREKYPGTGLGLAICKKIVERHGGRIWVDSQLHRGSTFHWTVPIHGGDSTIVEL
jgi:signal transduction histidine kinase